MAVLFAFTVSVLLCSAWISLSICPFTLEACPAVSAEAIVSPAPGLVFPCVPAAVIWRFGTLYFSTFSAFQVPIRYFWLGWIVAQDEIKNATVMAKHKVRSRFIFIFIILKK